MHQLIALFAGCLLYPPPNDPCQEARETQYEFLRNHGHAVAWNDNGTVRSMKVTGISLSGSIDGLQAGQPAREILEKIGPALLSAGTEELQVRHVQRTALIGDPTSPERTVRLQQFMRGREVHLGYVNISVNIQTNELTQVVANFLPNRGVDHLPRLPPGQAKAKARDTMRKSIDKHLGSEVRDLSFSDGPAYLAYAFEDVGGFGGTRGVLVWIFNAQDVESHESYQVSVDAGSGRIVRIWTNLLR